MSDIVNRLAEWQGKFKSLGLVIVRDKSIAVRSCAAEALTAMLNYDRDLAVKLFVTLCDTEDILIIQIYVLKITKLVL